MITTAAANMAKEEATKSACTIRVQLFRDPRDFEVHVPGPSRQDYVFEAKVIPMAQHVLISYETMEYRIPRGDEDAYEDVVDFLAHAMDDAADASHAVWQKDEDRHQYDYLGWGYDEDEDSEPSQSNIRLQRGEKTFFTRLVSSDSDLVQELQYCMRTLRFLNY